MNKKQLDQAIALGYETAAELAAFISGYEIGHLTGVRDTLDGVTKDIKDTLDIPEFLQEGFEPTSVTLHTNKED